ncbi:MAG: peptidoglycan-binding protein [Cyanobacteria bacterium P01_A01_bin.45]
MRLCRFSTLIFIYFTCLGLNPSYASIVHNDLAPELYEISQASSVSQTVRNLIKPGNRGDDVKKLQTQLKQLGYYDQVVDGEYGESTRTAVAKFQKAKDLSTDGIAGKTTQNAILKAIEEKRPVAETKKTDSQSNTEKKSSNSSNIVIWLLIAIASLGSLGTGIYFLKFSGRKKNIPQSSKEEDAASENKQVALSPPSGIDSDKTPNSKQISNSESNSQNSQNKNFAIENNVQPEQSESPDLVSPTHQTSRLTKVDIVERLIKDVQSADPTKRSKAIWNLGQKGDSRAIKPMIDSMIDADSQQRSLILAAVAEIGDRTLKPMNRALAISMQDESPQVRQNAIRDITRIYDIMGQISQMLSYALEDSDPQVQETAKYALSNMNRIRSLPASKENSTSKVTEESISEIRGYNSAEFNNGTPVN